MMKLLGSVLAMAAMIAGITVFYLSRFDLSPGKTEKPVAARAQAATTAPATGPQAVSLAADAQGHFVVDVRINGQFAKGLVDTGATIVAIPLAEAKRLGINPPASAYTSPIRTANGETKAAKVQLQEVRIGSVVVNGVEAAIVPNGLDVTLVGMSFFKRLASVEMRGKSLVLRQ